LFVGARYSKGSQFVITANQPDQLFPQCMIRAFAARHHRPQVSCMSGASDLVSDDQSPFPCLLTVAPMWRPVNATLIADNGEEVPIPHFTLHLALVPCNNDEEVLVLRPRLPSFCSPSSSPIQPLTKMHSSRQWQVPIRLCFHAFVILARVTLSDMILLLCALCERP
jgi:hypothetical protein